MEILDEKINSEVAVGTPLTDFEAMSLAIVEGAKGAGFVSPNPMVGCVVLSADGKFLSKGFHKKYGGPHAEVFAVENLTLAQLTGARVFVTLEPCAHEGKTPSCAKMLAKLPIAEVVFGLQDPNPLVSGQGAEIIKQAGVKVSQFHLLQNELKELCEHFLFNMQARKIWISAKVATSLDGVLAMRNGESKWITGANSRQYSHFLRAYHDAILVGANTILTDDPSLDIRHPNFPDKKNKVIVLDPQGHALAKIDSLKVAKLHAKQDLIFVLNSGMKNGNDKATVVFADCTQDCFDWAQIDTQLWQLGIRSIMVEGGALTHATFLNKKLVNRVYLFQAPILLGGVDGLVWTERLDIRGLQNKMELKNTKIKVLEPDVLITGLL